MTSRRVASWSRARILPRQQVYVTTPPPRSGTALRDELLATCSLAMAASGETEGAFAQPPQFVLLAVLAKLPADTRMRCAEVSRAWRDAASSPSLWRDIDLTEGSGITIPQFFVVDPWMRCRGANDAVLRAAAARAQGELQALRIACSGRTSLEALSSILATNARTLRKLCIRGYLHRLRQMYQKETAVITALLHAAPALEELELDLAMRIKALGVDEPAGLLAPLLRRDPAFAAVRLRSVNLCWDEHGDVRSLVALLASQPALTHVHVDAWASLTSAEVDAVFDAAANLRLTELKLNCTFPDDARAGDAVSRLLRRCATLTTLRLDLDWLCRRHARGVAPTLDDARQLGAALLANNCSLTSLSLKHFVDWQLDFAAGQHLLGALAQHPRLRTLELHALIDSTSWEAVVAEYAALIRHNRVLDSLAVRLSHNCGPCLQPPCYQACLRKLFEAVKVNVSLRCLSFDTVTEPFVSEQFLLDAVLPAVTACATLQRMERIDLGSGLAGRAIGKLLAARREGGAAAGLTTSDELGA
jgi:hypothetical protein